MRKDYLSCGGEIVPMKVLVFNSGSSTLKFRLLRMEHINQLPGPDERLSEGIVERVGQEGVVRFTDATGLHQEEIAVVTDHGEATRRVLKWLFSSNLLSYGELAAVGHRVVHGGNRFVGPTLIEKKTIQEVESLAELAPLHNGPALRVIHASRAVLGPSVPMVAVFDTDFHRTLPDQASSYAIPLELATNHKIKRYGFHGTAHRYMTERYALITSKPRETTKLVTLQLGAGCSITAVKGGRSVDTSMGFTPLEGLMMATRSGDVDPSLVGYLARHEGVSTDQVEEWLNTKSGLLGVSGFSQDMRDLLEAEGRGDARAALAIEMFCYRVKKYIGAYLAALAGGDAIIFGGGIGENSAIVRTRICKGLEWFGLTLDEHLNEAATGSEQRISSGNSKIDAYVIPVDEASVIARDTFDYINKSRHEEYRGY